MRILTFYGFIKIDALIQIRRTSAQGKWWEKL